MNLAARGKRKVCHFEGLPLARGISLFLAFKPGEIHHFVRNDKKALLRQTRLLQKRFRYAETAACLMSDSISERKITSPSADPSAASTARSGCGISPTTLRSRLHMPAIFASEPFGLAAASSRPSGVVYRNTIWRLRSR